MDRGHLVVAGGVAANQALRAELETLCARHGYRLLAPPLALCTDNGAMIGAAAAFRFAAGDRADPTLEAVPSLALPWQTAA